MHGTKDYSNSLKKLLIISPHFPPANAADMQRIRMSLPYFAGLGWHAEVVTCHLNYYESSTDMLLLESIPKNIKIHIVRALSKKWTSKLGLGSLALRSLWFYKQEVNQLLRQEKFDLIYFSTTQFPVCILGAYWKKKFNIPYVIDMQDPWHSDYYEDKPKTERPPKYWFSYRLNKWLEPIAMKNVDGLIAVSEQYNKDLVERYNLKIPTATITFGAFQKDFEIAAQNIEKAPNLIHKEKNKIKVGYIGRGGHDMKDALTLLFNSFKGGLSKDFDHFHQFEFHFLGTSYAAKGSGKQTICPLAKTIGIQDYVFEQTNRVPFYQTLNTLKEFDLLFICGSNDPKYTASKIYPYLMVGNPLLAIFHKKSSASNIIKECTNATVINFDSDDKDHKLLEFLQEYPFETFTLDHKKFKKYTAKEMTKAQCALFSKVIAKYDN